jgi:hypothetical protein
LYGHTGGTLAEMSEEVDDEGVDIVVCVEFNVPVVVVVGAVVVVVVVEVVVGLIEVDIAE